MSTFLGVTDAAQALGINESRVRALIAAEEMAAEKIGGRWLIDPAEVARRKREPRRTGRPLSPVNAWAALLSASGEDVPAGLDPVSRWRIERSLGQVGLVGLHARLSGRGRALHYVALPGALRELRTTEDVVLTGSSAAGHHKLELLGPETIDAYVPASGLDRIVRATALRVASPREADVILRAVPDGAWMLRGRKVAPIAAVGLDLADYPDSRSSRVGREVLARLDKDRRQVP